MSRNLTTLAGLALAMSLLCSAGLSAEPSDADAAAIDKVREMEEKSITAGDIEGVLSTYGEAIMYMPPNEPARDGKKGAREWLANATEKFDLHLEYGSSEKVVAGEWAFEIYGGTATFTPKDGGDPFTEEIKGIHIYQRGADGAWQIMADTWNTNAPPPAME